MLPMVIEEVQGFDLLPILRTAHGPANTGPQCTFGPETLRS